MTVAAPVLRFDDLTLGYDRHPAVHHLKGTVPRGDLLAVVGPNGAGKSTLLKGIVGGLRPQSGAISLIGVARDHIAYLPQQSDIDRSFPIAAFDFVAMGLWREVGALRGLGPDHRNAVAMALAAVGLGAFQESLPDMEVVRAPAHRLPVRRPDAAIAVRPPVAAGRAADSPR